MDRSLPVVSSGGAPRPLGVARLAMRRLSFTMPVRCLSCGGVRQGTLSLSCIPSEGTPQELRPLEYVP